ncbi:MAG: type 2 isopentenyl-diphosphate Delta-isomerase [Crenarchaeota archaeon]|nr:type 2 isopentenyl-diphosphate Delta-isomerase [Thermoproteota archaeon]
MSERDHVERNFTIFSRKDDHIIASLIHNVDLGSTWLEKVYIITDSAPEIDLSDVDTSVNFLGKKLSMPLIIGALTGGTELGLKINKILARVAEKCRLGICCGSQRIALENEFARESFKVIREEAPTTLKIANIGAPQVALERNEKKLVDMCLQAIDMIDADALAIHLNPLQECLQYEGEPTFRNLISNIELIVKSLKVPIIVKEVGYGISRITARKLAKIGVTAIEVAGRGGTSFTIIEKYRVKDIIDRELLYLYDTLSELGIPTLLSLCEVYEEFPGKIIASGGIRTGIDIAKTLIFGADMAAIARPFLEKALEGFEKVLKYVERISRELRIVMFLTNSKNIEEFKREANIIVEPSILEVFKIRGLTKCLSRVMKCT